ncbi:serine/arginine-rich splicing factor 5 isoform X3 [Aethina tumida]|uniref:serine/arginine-rich splicing factor 5 isoform X3 n=1 Tax=Aethina tumida TaxID=116153 RepID=UPI00214821EA|nr:serine/arginine-rich splicing factor 5 isoform X3 [Aethina tumida]
MSGNRLYLGKLPYDTTKRDLESFFKGYGRIEEILLKNGYGFIEFESSRDAEDAVYDLDGKKLLGQRISIEKARGKPRGRDRNIGVSDGYGIRGRGRKPVRTNYRLLVDNLSSRISWQDLKDCMREAGEVTYAEAHKPYVNEGEVEFATCKDMKRAIKMFDGYRLNGRKIELREDPETRRRRSPSGRRSYSRSVSRSRSRSRGSRKSGYRSRSRNSSRSRSRSRDSSRSRSRSVQRNGKSRSRSPSLQKKRDSSRSRSRSVQRNGKSSSCSVQMDGKSRSRSPSVQKKRDSSRSRSRPVQRNGDARSRSRSILRNGDSKSRSRSIEKKPQDERRSMSPNCSNDKEVPKASKRSRSRSVSSKESLKRSASRSPSRSPKKSKIEEGRSRSLSQERN